MAKDPGLAINLEVVQGASYALEQGLKLHVEIWEKEQGVKLHVGFWEKEQRASCAWEQHGVKLYVGLLEKEPQASCAWEEQAVKLYVGLSEKEQQGVKLYVGLSEKEQRVNCAWEQPGEQHLKHSEMLQLQWHLVSKHWILVKKTLKVMEFWLDRWNTCLKPVN